VNSSSTLLLSRSAVDELLTMAECIDVVEEMFRHLGEGKLPPPGILGIKSERGGLHIKAALLPGERDYIVAKLNTNFPGNPAEHDLPTIQGLIMVCDGANGRPLAVLDSIDITMKRTAAASAVAAKYLARPNSSVATICGCGQQAAAQLRAICSVLPLKKSTPSIAIRLPLTISSARSAANWRPDWSPDKTCRRRSGKVTFA
jgi:ornithine cyclodeaminase/alanine dehydrogenase